MECAPTNFMRIYTEYSVNLPIELTEFSVYNIIKYIKRRTPL